VLRARCPRAPCALRGARVRGAACAGARCARAQVRGARVRVLVYDIRMKRHALICGLLLLAVACAAKDDAPGAIPAPADVAKPPADALMTPSGIASRVLSVGLGSIHPRPTNTVRVNYVGWTTDGKMFDSSASHGGPIEFQLNGVIPGWTEGVQLMVKGEKRRFWIPGKLAYDDIPDPTGSNPKGMLVFDIELLDIK
jgi:FKBP-type peptidyl-prolyl cis-trans isomerase